MLLTTEVPLLLPPTPPLLFIPLLLLILLIHTTSISTSTASADADAYPYAPKVLVSLRSSCFPLMFRHKEWLQLFLHLGNII